MIKNQPSKKSEIISTVLNFPENIDLNYVIHNLTYKNIIEQGLKEIETGETINATKLLQSSNEIKIGHLRFGCNWAKSAYALYVLIKNHQNKICSKIDAILLGQRANEKKSELLANLHIDDENIHVVDSSPFYIILKVIHNKPYIAAIIKQKIHFQ